KSPTLLRAILGRMMSFRFFFCSSVRTCSISLISSKPRAITIGASSPRSSRSSEQCRRRLVRHLQEVVLQSRKVACIGIPGLLAAETEVDRSSDHRTIDHHGRGGYLGVSDWVFCDGFGPASTFLPVKPAP